MNRYDGETETGDGRGFDIDHLVRQREAWDSGAHGWDAQARERFANDLGYEHSLVAVSTGFNRRNPWSVLAWRTHLRRTDNTIICWGNDSMVFDNAYPRQPDAPAGT